MKKIISLILSIALLATLMPTILVSAAEETGTVTLAVPITEDTFLAGRNVGDPGDATIGNPGEKEYLAVSNSTKRYYNNKILLKAAFANVENLPTDKVVSKAELVMNRIAWDSSIINYTYVNWINEEFSSNLYIYPASKNWNEETKIAAWIADETAYPKLDSDGFLADETTSKTDGGVTSFLAPTTDTPVEIKFDITDIFVESLGGKSLSQSSEVAFFAQVATVYKTMAFASSEHSNTALHPYINITLIDKPELSEISSELPEMLTDVFAVELSNDISSVGIVVNGTTLENSQYTINGNKIELNYDFEPLTDYTVAFTATDNYGQSFSKTYTFSTLDENGADASGVIKKYITEDTSLAAGNISGGYGKYNSGSDTAIRWRAQSGADGAYLLHKIPTGLVNIPEGKAITKVELGISTYYDSSLLYSEAGKFSNAPIKIYSASSDWTESTTMQEWCPDYTATPAITHIPEITWNSSPYCTINSDPAVTTSCSLVALSTDAPSQNLLFDITPVYSEALSKNLVDSDGNFSVITQVGTNNYWGTGVASAENENIDVRPYVLITVSDKISEYQTASEFYSYTINTGTTTPVLDKSGTVYVLRNNSKQAESNYKYNCTVLMKFALTNNYYDEFAVTYTSADSPAVERIYGFDNDNGTFGANLVYEDLDATLYDSSKLIGAPSYEDKVCTIDVADYANECVANGKSAMYLLIGTDGNTSSISKILPTAVAQKAIEPTITFTGSTPAIAGSYIKSINAKFTTVLANSAADKVELYKGATKVEDVEFVAKGNTIDFAAPTKLEENTSYIVVLKAGATDLFGNTTTEDIEIAAFTTGVDFVNHGIKLFAKDTDVEKDAFATTDGLAAATVGAELQGYWRADNNAIEEKALIIAIGAYNDDNELLGVQFSAFDANDEEAKIYKTNALTVPTGATKIKAFGWDGTSQAAIAFAEIPVQ